MCIRDRRRTHLENVYHRTVILELLSIQHRCSGYQLALFVVPLWQVLLLQERVKLPCLSPVSYTHLLGVPGPMWKTTVLRTTCRVYRQREVMDSSLSL